LIEKIGPYLENEFLLLDAEFGCASGTYSAAKSGVSLGSSGTLEVPRFFRGELGDIMIDVGQHIEMDGDQLMRSLSFSIVEKAFLFDFVSRLVIWSNDRPAMIAGREIVHESSNIYHQYSVQGARLPIGSHDWITVSDGGSIAPPGFDVVFYVRDEGVEANGLKRWVLHHRLIANIEMARLVIMGCNPKFSGPIPFQLLVPKVVKKALFRIRETRFPSFPLMAIGECSVSPGLCADIKTRMNISNE
jgi:hypothetical protein